MTVRAGDTGDPLKSKAKPRCPVDVCTRRHPAETDGNHGRPRDRNVTFDLLINYVLRLDKLSRLLIVRLRLTLNFHDLYDIGHIEDFI